ncbi:diguanylate cyclase [Desulfonatronospira sp.]|uniref:GGDEF domain-containing protein n=1 Tax=Desulfonatronospira sp. TaxID=1962951 RepID=UPI0025B90CA3|nr:diguanylate cyclase [Desulfonatronospira sp.]
MHGSQAVFHLVGISRELRLEIEDNLPGETVVEEVNGSGPLFSKAGKSGINILFLSPGRWENMDQEIRDELERYNQHLVLVLDDDSPQLKHHYNVSASFLGYLRRPVTRNALKSIRDKAREVQELYDDLHLMAREIVLERELLTRKNAQLEFLNRILTKTSQTLDLAEILQATAGEFETLLGTTGLAAVFWNHSENGMLAEIYLPEIQSKKIRQDWITHLIEVAKRFEGQAPKNYNYIPMNSGKNGLHQRPTPTRQILLPLQNRQSTFGALVLVSEEVLRLGRDQTTIINSAARHLALSIRNSLKYKAVKFEADFDGLTCINNRQNFDKKIRKELKRHQRQGASLSLIMLDLDHFKALNDMYGHLTGDMVLKKIGEILVNTVRETDFPARYGGEEFVILLPETNEEQAWLLGQRIRQKIGQTVFQFKDKKFSITASLGVASIKPGPLTPKEALVEQADQALYLSKFNGRNMVCTSAEVCMEQMVSH